MRDTIDLTAALTAVKTLTVELGDGRYGFAPDQLERWEKQLKELRERVHILLLLIDVNAKEIL